MSAVDVLAVMGRYIALDEAPTPSGDTPTIAHDLREALDAVAELMLAANAELSQLERRAKLGAISPDERACLNRLRNALARIEGRA